MPTAIITSSSTLLHAASDGSSRPSSVAIRYSAHSPLPYSGRYGPTQKPGSIHLRSGLFDEKKRRKNTSSTQPNVEPTKNKNASDKKMFVAISPSFVFFDKYPLSLIKKRKADRSGGKGCWARR